MFFLIFLLAALEAYLCFGGAIMSYIISYFSSIMTVGQLLQQILPVSWLTWGSPGSERCWLACHDLSIEEGGPLYLFRASDWHYVNLIYWKKKRKKKKRFARIYAISIQRMGRAGSDMVFLCCCSPSTLVFVTFCILRCFSVHHSYKEQLSELS